MKQRHVVFDRDLDREPWLADFDTSLDYQNTALKMVRRASGNLKRACNMCQEILITLVDARDLAINLDIDRDEDWIVAMGADIVRYRLAYGHLSWLRPPKIAYKWLQDANAGNERMRALAMLGYNERNRKVFQAIDIVMTREA